MKTPDESSERAVESMVYLGLNVIYYRVECWLVTSLMFFCWMSRRFLLALKLLEVYSQNSSIVTQPSPQRKVRLALCQWHLRLYMVALYIRKSKWKVFLTRFRTIFQILDCLPSCNPLCLYPYHLALFMVFDVHIILHVCNVIQ